MAVFIPVAVLASGFLADVVSAAPIAEQSYANGLSELDEEKEAFFGAIKTLLSKPGVAGGILGTFGALAGGVGSVLGATGHKREVAFENMDDEEKEAFFGAIKTVLSKPGVAGGILGTFGALAGGVGSVLGATGHKREIALENMDDEEKEAFFGAIKTLLSKPGVAGGILGTFGALAGGVGSVLGATGQKRSVGESTPLLGDDDEDKEAFWALVPAIAGAIGGAMGLGAGIKQHIDNGKKPKRSVGESTPLLGLDDEDKEAFWSLVPAIAGAIGGVMGLGAGVKQHIDNGKKPKRSVGESTALLGVDDEDKEAFWKLVPAIAGAIGGVLGLGAGVKQHIDNGKPKRAIEFGMERRDLEDMALLARMIDDSEFY